MLDLAALSLIVVLAVVLSARLFPRSSGTAPRASGPAPGTRDERASPPREGASAHEGERP